MESQDDGALLARYAIDEDQDAFRALTERYAPLVYGVCRRKIGQSDLAQDASQVVFLILARKARRLAGRRTIAPWLYCCAANVSRSILRTEARRKQYEREAIDVWSGQEESTFDVDSALSRLSGKDRDAIVLRYLHGHSLAEVASALGVGEDAARMRVNRALAKLKSDLGPGLALESIAAINLAIPPRLLGTPGEFLKVLPNRYARLIGGHSFMLSTPALSLLSLFVILGGASATVALRHGKPDANTPVARTTLLQEVIPGSKTPDKDVLKDFQLEILGTWTQTLGTEDGGKTTKFTFPGTVVKTGKKKGDLVLHADQTSPSLGSMDAKWNLDVDQGVFHFLTDGPSEDDSTPLHLISTGVNQKKASVAVFEGKSPKASYKVTVTFTHDRFDFVATGQNADGSKITPERATITLERQTKG